MAVFLIPAHAALAGGGDEGLPKKPDRPYTVAVVVAPGHAPIDDASAKALKEVEDSRDDIRKNVARKRKAWFALVDDPARAEILLELKGRGWEKGHGAVLEGKVRVFHLEPIKIIGQGGLDPGDLSFRPWHQAASDMTRRLQVFCQESYDRISKARRMGVRPLAAAANDRGVERLKNDQIDAAVASFDDAIRLAPSFLLPHLNRGLTLSMVWDWRGAAASFDAVIQIDPAHQRAYYYRAQARRELDDLSGARADLDQAIRLDPGHADAWLERATVESRLGDSQAAIADLDRVIALDPTRRGTVLARQGVEWERMGDVPRALAAYEAAVATGHADAAVHYNRGRLLVTRGEEARACSAFARAADLDGKDPVILLQRGICRAKQGQLADAIQDFSECVRLKPDLAVAYYNRGLCYHKQGNGKLARADRARALELDPSITSRN
jgi:tetratricopeptide (TPR) repeat protein